MFALRFCGVDDCRIRDKNNLEDFVRREEKIKEILGYLSPVEYRKKNVA